MKYYIIDAFTDKLFEGNPAGVCLPEKKLSEALMQKIAFENNLPETAFVFEEDGICRLQWFTPEYEMDLCGHATLAAAYVMLNDVHPLQTEIRFETASGTLTVTRNKDLFLMDLPRRAPAPVTTDARLSAALGCKVLETLAARDLLVLVRDEATVRSLTPDFTLLGQIDSRLDFTLIVTAQGDVCDFVSRFFMPNTVEHEDPVTGSAHSTLIPFWSKRLGKNKLLAKQLSHRGGTLLCEDAESRVLIGGKACRYLEGEIKL